MPFVCNCKAGSSCYRFAEETFKGPIGDQAERYKVILASALLLSHATNPPFLPGPQAPPFSGSLDFNKQRNLWHATSGHVLGEAELGLLNIETQAVLGVDHNVPFASCQPPK